MKEGFLLNEDNFPVLAFGVGTDRHIQMQVTLIIFSS